jgi:hypothetical protein
MQRQQTKERRRCTGARHTPSWTRGQETASPFRSSGDARTTGSRWRSPTRARVRSSKSTRTPGRPSTSYPFAYAAFRRLDHGVETAASRAGVEARAAAGLHAEASTPRGVRPQAPGPAVQAQGALTNAYRSLGRSRAVLQELHGAALWKAKMYLDLSQLVQATADSGAVAPADRFGGPGPARPRRRRVRGVRESGVVVTRRPISDAAPRCPPTRRRLSSRPPDAGCRRR